MRLCDLTQDSPHLVSKILYMIIAELLGTYDTMEIGLHQLLYEIDLSKIMETWRPEDIEDGDDIFMAKMTKKFDFAESTKTEHRVLKGRNTFYSYSSLSRDMDGRARFEAIRKDREVKEKKTDQTMP